MRIQILSDNSHGNSFIYRLNQSGHDVQHGPRNGSYVPDFIVNFTSNVVNHTTAKYLGQSRWSDAIDSDADYMQKVIGLIGWPTKPSFQGGVNMYFTIFFNGDSIILSYVSILYRRLMAGGCGPDIGCAGSISLFDCLSNKTEETFLKPLIKILKRVSHQGVLHIHAVTNAESFYVKGISTRLYHPLTLVALENTNLAVVNVFLKLLDITSHAIRPLDKIAASILLSVPPYPYALKEWNEHNEIKGINPASLKHLWLEDVSLEDRVYVCGNTGTIGYVTARGTSPQEACRRIYKTISNLSTPDIQYRNDIGRNINTLLESLKTSGWVN